MQIFVVVTFELPKSIPITRIQRTFELYNPFINSLIFAQTQSLFQRAAQNSNPKHQKERQMEILYLSTI